jgi:hypothetical protein
MPRRGKNVGMKKLLPYLIGAAIALAICFWRYHNGSYDIGLHYSLAAHIADTHRFPDCTVDQHLYMCWYPPISHFAAAMVGTLIGSTFAGIHVVSVLAVFAAYAALFSMLRLTVIGVLLAICALSRLHPFLIGTEVLGNYFFAQLVGTAAVLVFIAMQSRANIVLSLVAVFCFGWLYPISALQLAGIVTVQLALDRRWRSVAVFAPIAAAAIYFHPLYQLAADAASNDGAIDIGYLPRGAIYPATTLLIVLALVSRNVIGNRMMSIALGFAGAAIAQILAFVVLHKGSSYIVEKHIFGVSTLIVVISASWIPLQLPQRAPWMASAGAVIMCLVTLFPLRMLRGISIPDVMASERAVRKSPDSLGDVPFSQERFSFRLGILHQPLGPAFAAEEPLLAAKSQ